MAELSKRAAAGCLCDDCRDERRAAYAADVQAAGARRDAAVLKARSDKARALLDKSLDHLLGKGMDDTIGLDLPYRGRTAAEAEQPEIPAKGLPYVGTGGGLHVRWGPWKSINTDTWQPLRQDGPPEAPTDLQLISDLRREVYRLNGEKVEMRDLRKLVDALVIRDTSGTGVTYEQRQEAARIVRDRADKLRESAVKADASRETILEADVKPGRDAAVPAANLVVSDEVVWLDNRIGGKLAIYRSTLQPVIDEATKPLHAEIERLKGRIVEKNRVLNTVARNSRAHEQKAPTYTLAEHYGTQALACEQTAKD